MVVERDKAKAQMATLSDIASERTPETVGRVLEAAREELGMDVAFVSEFDQRRMVFRELVEDVTNVFNYLTGYSNQKDYRSLLVAPVQLRTRLTELIMREAEHARAGRGASEVRNGTASAPPARARNLAASTGGTPPSSRPTSVAHSAPLS